MLFLSVEINRYILRGILVDTITDARIGNAIALRYFCRIC